MRIRQIQLAVLFVAGAVVTRGQTVPGPEDSRRSLLREAALGILPGQPAISERNAGQRCLELPVSPPDDRLAGPHGNALISARCEVLSYETLNSTPPSRWTAARYRWTSIFSAEDKARSPGAQDTVTEEEVVVFDVSRSGPLHPVWHARFETGAYAALRSVTPEAEPMPQGGTLLSVMSCVNGTGGCGQEFLCRHPDGRWFPVWQDWYDQLPRGFAERIRHGVRIDPRTLRGEGGFYADSDANCCPSERLLVDLALRGDSLALVSQNVVREREP